MNENDVRQFYRFLGHEKETEIRILDPKNRAFTLSFPISNEEDFVKICQKYDGLYNIYAGINERSPGGNSDDDIKVITVIGHDIDCHGENSNLQTAKQQALSISESAVDNGFHEPLIVFSGGGYWVLHKIDAIPNTTENAEKIKVFASRIKKMWEVPGIEFDTKVYNPSRIARVSGTLNLRSNNLSRCINNPSSEPDIALTREILEIESPKYENLSFDCNVDLPKGCMFMDYCLTHLLPIGERHSVISRNMSLYINDKPNRAELKAAYIKVQEAKDGELNNWLNSITKNQGKKFPFSCGELIKYQRKYNIPLQCLNCEKFNEYHNKQELKGGGRILNIKDIAEQKGFTVCPTCHNNLEFNSKKGWFGCKTCNYFGGLKKLLFMNILTKKQQEVEIK